MVAINAALDFTRSFSITCALMMLLRYKISSAAPIAAAVDNNINEEWCIPFINQLLLCKHLDVANN